VTAAAALLTVLLWPWQASRVPLLERAAAEISGQDYAAAEDLLQPLVTSVPPDPLALNLLGIVRMRQQKPSEAEQLFRRAIAAGPDLAGPHVNLAMVTAAGRPLEAIAELQAALRSAPENAQARDLLRSLAKTLCQSKMRAGQKDVALAIAIKARDALPRDAALQYNFGLAALESNLDTEAAAAFEKSLELQPDLAESHYGLARAYLALSKAQPAEEQIRLYLAARPSDASAYYGLGFILAAEQRLKDAQAAFEKSLELEPNQTESQFQLGEIDLQSGDTAAAARRYQAVLGRNPDHAGALAGLGMIAYRVRDFSTAVERLAKAVQLAPSYQKAHYFYALTLAKLGRKDEASREFAESEKLSSQAAPQLRLESLRP
jgi:tetratricopeptide (TPR) repeat protein